MRCAVGKEFDVVLDENKISEAGYNARHLDIRLKANRAELSEYRDFEGLVCEVQLTTTLYHAWSSLYHDDMYKDIESLKAFDEEAFNRIDSRFQKVMEVHIREASYEFSYLMGEITRLREGKEVLSPEFVQQRLLGSETLNSLHSTLSLYKNAIARFGEKALVGRKAVEIIAAVIRRASELPDTTDTDFLWTTTEESVIALGLETLKPLRYYYCDDVIRLCIQYVAHANEEVSKKAKEIILESIDYKLDALKAIGYYPQQIVLTELEALSDNDLGARSVTVRECCEKLLQPTFDASRMTTHETIEIGQGSLKADEALRKVRTRAIELLKRLFTLSESLAEKRMTLHSMTHATRTPASVKYSEELEVLVLEDAVSLCDWYKTLIGSEALIIRADIHDLLFWLQRRFSDRVTVIVEELRSLLEADKEYRVFRDLVGYDTDREPVGDWETTRTNRLKAISDYVDDITPATSAYWMALLTRIVSNHPAAPDEYGYFGDFLHQIGRKKPDFAMTLVRTDVAEMEPFLPFLLEGLLGSEHPEYVTPALRQWIIKGERLVIIARLLNLTKELDIELLTATIELALQRDDPGPLRLCVRTIIQHFDRFDETRILFVRAIKRLTELEDAQWTMFLWQGVSEIASLVDEKESVVILDNLVFDPRLDLHVDSFIRIFAERFPVPMIGFFKNRAKRRELDKSLSYYDVVPYRFHATAEHFQKRWDEYLPLVFDWYKEAGQKSWSYAAEFVRACFPAWNDTLERSLMKIIADNDPSAPDFIIDILQRFEGEHTVQPIAVEYLKRYGGDPDRRRSLGNALRSTGVVSGPFGFADAYKEKRDWIATWPFSEEPGIKEFIAEMTETLDHAEKSERKRAEQELHRRKADFE